MIDDTRLAAFGQYTPEGHLTPGYGDTYLFFAGRDNIHRILCRMIGDESMGLKLSMFGYDDPMLNQIIMNLMMKRHVRVQVSLDRRQAGGQQEYVLLDLDRKLDPTDFNNSFAVITSPTGEILHTKGGVLLGQGIAFEGSTNWSASGEGTGTGEDVKGVKAQSNTLLITTNPVVVNRFTASLDIEHSIGLARQAKRVK